MLRAEGLAFYRGEARVVQGASFALAPGELLKVVSGNGGGKTTLLRGLAGLLPLAEGELRWRGAAVAADPDAYREDINLIGHDNGLAGDLTPAENLRAAAALRLRAPRMPLADALLAAGAPWGAPCGRLSAGQRRRAALARLRAFCAQLWLLDEPLAALDADGRQMMQNWLRDHLAQGGMAICTMHAAEEIAGGRVMTLSAGIVPLSLP